MDSHIQKSSLFKHDGFQENPNIVSCLGMKFRSEDERRNYFIKELKRKLPDLKKQPGFPKGEDEDILNLSDPPYYTACPNPWMNHFIDDWNEKKKNKDSFLDYRQEAYTADVIEGKTDPFYMAHAYHTKVPYKAIMRYILHYTQPGDIVYDGFSGSGMTGVAAAMCANASLVEQLEIRKKVEIGKRHAILNDLSSAATHISNNLNNTKDFKEFVPFFQNLIGTTKKKYEWMFNTKHKEGQSGQINYVVWSENFICPNCANEFTYWDAAVNLENKKMRETFQCEKCKSLLQKKDLNKVLESHYHDGLGKVYQEAKYTPVLINYSVGNKRHEKAPDKKDQENFKRIRAYNSPYMYPINEIISGDEIDRLKNIHFKYVFQLLSIKNNIFLADIYNEIMLSKYKNLGLFVLTASLHNLTYLYRWRINKKGGSTSGTYYVSSLVQENNPYNQLNRKLNDIQKIEATNSQNVVSTQSSTSINIKNCSVDYIFTDPPFGSNLMYSELNYIWESWLKVFSNKNDEAIINKSQNKDYLEYKELMYNSLKENYRILKPGRWMTVVFSNSKASVWNIIQESIQKAGFIIANVSALDKKQGSFKAVTTTTAVKQDLVISAYKPKEENINKIRKTNTSNESSWTFVSQHLEQLPIYTKSEEYTQIIPERTPRILFDRMVAYFVQKGLKIQVSSAEFQLGVSQRFPMRDGMVFLESQVAEYDKKRTMVKDFSQLNLFVSDENSAIEWLRQQLLKKPQTRQEIHPQFMKELQHIAKHEILPELDDLLNQNFLRYDGEDEVPSQILTHLRRNYKDLRGLEGTNPRVIEKAKHRWFVPNPNKQADLEMLREKSLLREYENYLKEIEGNKKKLKSFRTEAIRAGFKKAYSEKDFESIVQVGDRIPEKVLQEDDKLLMYYDNALIRMGL